jgi:hypothetical protein
MFDFEPQKLPPTEEEIIEEFTYHLLSYKI